MRPIATIFLICSLLAAGAWWSSDPRIVASQSSVSRQASGSVAKSYGAVSESSVSLSPTPATESPRLAREISALLRGGYSSDREIALEKLLPRLLAIDAPTAAALVADSPTGPIRDILLRQLARTWAARDIGAAFEWMQALSQCERAQAAEAVIDQVAESDPAGALATAELFEVGIADGRAEHILQLWMEESPEAAIAWLQSRPAGNLRDRLVARATWVRAQGDPIDAVAIATSMLAPGEWRDEASLGIVRHWSARDPAAAAAWVATLPGPLHMRAKVLLGHPL